nr:MAG TPA: Protein melan-A [Caudoviricetes sp.]
MYNDIIAGLTIAGTFFTAGFIGAVWDFKRVQRKKVRQAKQDAIMQQYKEDLQEKFNEGYQAFQTDLAYARKHSHSDNDWSMAEA